MHRAQVNHAERTLALVFDYAAGTDGSCLPRRQMFFKPSFLELNGVTMTWRALCISPGYAEYDLDRVIRHHKVGRCTIKTRVESAYGFSA